MIKVPGRKEDRPNRLALQVSNLPTYRAGPLASWSSLGLIWSLMASGAAVFFIRSCDMSLLGAQAPLTRSPRIKVTPLQPFYNVVWPHVTSQKPLLTLFDFRPTPETLCSP